MNRPKPRTQDCTRANAKTRLAQAELYLQVAEMVLSEEAGEEATVAGGNAVLAGIAAADAICCVTAGARFRGQDHRQAADYLQEVTGDAHLGGLLRDVVDAKDGSHYGLANVKLAQAKSAVRKAGQLVAEARRRIG